MARSILPKGTTVSLTAYGNINTLFIDSIEQTYISEPFVRTEFTHEKQKQALEQTGRAPIYGSLLSGDPVQFIYGTGTTARNLQPDDADLENIYKKFFITRYTMTGDISSVAACNALATLAADHKSLLDQFNATRKFAEGNVSIVELTNLQSQTYSYLTTTTASMSGLALPNGTISNLFCREFSTDIARVIVSPALVLSSWSATFDIIQILDEDAEV